MTAPKPYDDGLVDDLAQRTADSLDWDWPTTEVVDGTTVHVYPSGPDTIRPEVELILDRLVELGWLPPIPPGAMAAAIGPCAYCERDGVKVHREVAGGVCTDERACWHAYTAQDAE